jgi:HD-GYP domain-containing protein (c-di-GMP phosphodiesterase class II)
MIEAYKSLRLAELIGALSHALDITEGQPKGHATRCCWIGMHLGMALELPQEQLSDLYYTLLLKDLGCSSNAARVCELYLNDDRQFKRDSKLMQDSLPQILRFIVSNTGPNMPVVKRLQAIINILQNGGSIVNELIEARCFRGADIAKQMRFSEAVCKAIAHLDEHWDGSGRPDNLKADAIPMLSQIALLSQVADVFNAASGSEAAIAEVSKRSGTWFNPKLAAAFSGMASLESFWLSLKDENLNAKVLTLEPTNAHRKIDENYLDEIALAFAKVIDAKSPFTAGHSERVAAYSVMIAQALGETQQSCRTLHRAALLHDIGKLGISNSILDKPDKLTPEEFDTMKMHPVHSGEILNGISVFKDIVHIARHHHEKLDGSGYPHGLKGDDIPLLTRIVTVADIYDALTANRPYRAAMPVTQALDIMAKDAGTKLDQRSFEALRTIMSQFAVAA